MTAHTSFDANGISSGVLELLSVEVNARQTLNNLVYTVLCYWAEFHKGIEMSLINIGGHRKWRY